MSKSKINKPWERPRSGEPHSPPGIDRLRTEVKGGLMKFFTGIAETMFEYRGIEDPKLADALEMSRDTVPEKFLFRNGECCIFEVGDQLHILPIVYDGGINIYGNIARWHPVPVGWADERRAEFSAEMAAIRDLDLGPENSVILRNDIFGRSDLPYIEALVDELVDNVLTVNQLQLLASSPYIFNVSEDNVLTAKNYFLALASRAAVIFKNSLGDKLEPVLEKTDVRIDPAIFEIYDRFECMILEALGFSCVPITKRAQQTVSEVQSNDDKIRMKRREKLLQRQRDWARVNAMFGTSVQVVSVLDEIADQEQEQEVDDDAAEERMSIRRTALPAYRGHGGQDPRHRAADEASLARDLFRCRDSERRVRNRDNMIDPWIPTYADIIHRREAGEDHYQGIGFDNLEVSEDDCPLVHAALSRLDTRFSARFANRRINAETLTRWQMRLQNRMDEIASKYQLAYELYTAYADRFVSGAVDGWKETGKTDDDLSGIDSVSMAGSESTQASGTDSIDDESVGRTIDTPDAATNASANYADKRQYDERTVETTYGWKDTTSYDRLNRQSYGKQRDIAREVEHIVYGDMPGQLERTLRSFRDIDTAFVAEFENLFLNIFWYRGIEMTRVSLEELYNDKDLLTLIYRLMDDIDAGAISDISMSEESGVCSITITMHDGTVHSISWSTSGTEAVWGNISGTLANQTDLAVALAAKAALADLAAVATSGAYSDLSGTPTIPEGLPDTSGASEGQVVMLDANLEAEWADPETGLPDTAGASEGQVLALDSNLDAEWVDPETGLPDTSGASEGAILTLDSNLDPAWAPSVEMDGKLWKQLDLSDLPTDMVEGDCLLIYPKAVSTDGSSVDNNAAGCLIRVMSGTGWYYPEIVYKSTGNRQVILLRVAKTTDWNAATSTTVLFRLGNLDQSGATTNYLDIAKADIPNYFNAIYRMVDAGSVINVGATWGNIVGTLANQADLAAALALKEDAADLAAVAESGAYSDLSGTPSLAAVATSGAYSDLSGTPSLAAVATSGAYSDLSGTPTVPSVTSGTLTLAVADWGNVSYQVKTVSGASSGVLIIGPSPASTDDYIAAGLRITAQSGDNLTFTADTVPTVAIEVSWSLIA